MLPFKPLVAEHRDEVLEMGMADTLIARLNSSRAMIVCPLGSVRRYNGLEQDPVLAARELAVDSVLDGSIQRDGTRIRVTVRLLRVADGTSLWVQKFDQEFTDVFDVKTQLPRKWWRRSLCGSITTSGENLPNATPKMWTPTTSTCWAGITSAS